MKYKHSKEKQKEVLKKYAGGGRVKEKYYDTYVSLKGGFDLYKINGNEQEDVFLGNYKSIQEAENEAKKIGLEKRPIWMRYADKGVYVETLDEKIDLSEEGRVRARKTQQGGNKSFGERREMHGASPEALAFAEGGSLGNHGLKQGDQIIKTMSGGVQKVKTKSGDIVYVNLANGYRGDVPPLPFDGGGRLKSALMRDRKNVNYSQDYEVRYSKDKSHRSGYTKPKMSRTQFEEESFEFFDNGGGVKQVDLFQHYDKQPKELSEIVNAYMEKFDEGDYDYEDNKNFLKEVESVGYTFDYGLDNEPYALRPIGVKLSQVEGYEDMDFNKGGFMTDPNFGDFQNQVYAGGGGVYNESKYLTKEQWEKWNDYVKTGKIDGKKEKNMFIVARHIGVSVAQIDAYEREKYKNYATGGVTKNYINRKQLNTITVKKGDQKLTYKVSDVYNGAYKLEDGGNLEKMAFYIPKRNVVKVQLRDGKDVKVANGYWIKKGAKPIHTSKYDDGGEVEYKGGGKTTFKEKATAIAKNFEGKKVEPKYQKEYGKTYDKAEAKEVGNKIAGSQKAKYDSKMSGGGSTEVGYFKNEIDNDYISEINKYFNKWNGIKTEKDSENFKKIKPPMFGTYKNVTILEQISKFENKDVPFDANQVLRNDFKKEVSKIIDKLSNSKSYSGGGSTTKRGGAMVLAKQIRKDGESWQSALKRANEQLKK
jgi:hypothetical protein